MSVRSYLAQLRALRVSMTTSRRSSYLLHLDECIDDFAHRDHNWRERRLPPLPATEEKAMLQLIVQLLKRWRELHYAKSEYPPILIVLTTLAADLYTGEQSLSIALLQILDGIVERLDRAHATGLRLEVLNSVHRDEDFSERWDTCAEAYLAFTPQCAELSISSRQS